MKLIISSSSGKCNDFYNTKNTEVRLLKKIKNFLRSQEYLICFSFDINEIDLFDASRSFSVKERKKKSSI